MNNPVHRVVGFYDTLAQAEATRERLLAHGLPPERVRTLRPGQGGAGPEGEANSDDVLKELVRDGAIGTAAGTVAGAAGSLALAAANISLFLASPVLGTLVMLGWGASLGGLLGAAVGAQTRTGDTADLVKDALASGHVVLVVHTDSEAQTVRARQVIADSMAGAGATAPA
jgi:hypothetical protein